FCLKTIKNNEFIEISKNGILAKGFQNLKFLHTSQISTNCIFLKYGYYGLYGNNLKIVINTFEENFLISTRELILILTKLSYNLKSVIFIKCILPLYEKLNIRNKYFHGDTFFNKNNFTLKTYLFYLYVVLKLIHRKLLLLDKIYYLIPKSIQLHNVNNNLMAFCLFRLLNQLNIN
ncbi:hypothetical protein AGLY_014153, partial [Aphis glycines]